MGAADTNPTFDIRSEEQIDTARAEDYIRGLGCELAPTTKWTQFRGGSSNITYLVSDGTNKYVLRRPPLGPVVKTGHDMGREYRFLTALGEAGFRLIPKVFGLCEDASILDTSFYIMQYCEGALIGRTGQFPAAFDTSRESLYLLGHGAIQALSDLHRLDVTRSPLQELGKPEGYLERQVNGWIDRWHRSKIDVVPDMELAAELLFNHLPASGNPAVVHNDYKLDNLMFDPNDTTKVKTILDWEMAALGDPLTDVGYFISMWIEADDPPVFQAFGLAPTGIPSAPKRKDLRAWYAECSGRDINALPWYEGFAYFRLAVILQQIYARFHAGQTTDPRFAMYNLAVPPLAEAALLRLKET